MSVGIHVEEVAVSNATKRKELETQYKNFQNTFNGRQINCSNES